MTVPQSTSSGSAQPECLICRGTLEEEKAGAAADADSSLYRVQEICIKNQITKTGGHSYHPLCFGDWVVSRLSLASPYNTTTALACPYCTTDCEATIVASSDPDVKNIKTRYDKAIDDLLASASIKPPEITQRRAIRSMFYCIKSPEDFRELKGQLRHIYSVHDRVCQAHKARASARNDPQMSIHIEQVKAERFPLSKLDTFYHQHVHEISQHVLRNFM